MSEDRRLTEGFGLQICVSCSNVYALLLPRRLFSRSSKRPSSRRTCRTAYTMLDCAVSMEPMLTRDEHASIESPSVLVNLPKTTPHPSSPPRLPRLWSSRSAQPGAQYPRPQTFPASHGPRGSVFGHLGSRCRGAFELQSVEQEACRSQYHVCS
ncbi:hypothetical protein FA95DRAFT_772766 [Auriscalpium vulgare]|uniref:Uncharacterized protein n=1 Tax=Auriscalpium vulgare TaxID=40419 RepID=A0ACB8RBM8_9AGAM|nr:hypothetical protein FA95DRAFT_772766 [Auriscalpium vulgare]